MTWRALSISSYRMCTSALSTNLTVEFDTMIAMLSAGACGAMRPGTFAC